MQTAIDISTSGLVAQRIRLDAISGNIANISTMVDENGDNKPYQPRFTIFQTDEDLSTQHGAVGVKVSEVRKSDVEPVYRYMPHHEMADENGYVAFPNINLTQEFVDALEATRAYEANVGVIEVSKDMGNQTLRIIA